MSADIDINKMTIEHIIDGWVLESPRSDKGKLYLIVKCEDGVIRTVTKDRTWVKR